MYVVMVMFGGGGGGTVAFACVAPPALTGSISPHLTSPHLASPHPTPPHPTPPSRATQSARPGTSPNGRGLDGLGLEPFEAYDEYEAYEEDEEEDETGGWAGEGRYGGADVGSEYLSAAEAESYVQSAPTARNGQQSGRLRPEVEAYVGSEYLDPAEAEYYHEEPLDPLANTWRPADEYLAAEDDGEAASVKRTHQAAEWGRLFLVVALLGPDAEVMF